MPDASIIGALGSFFSSSAGSAVLTGVGTAAAGAGISSLLAPKSRINVPPPPGAAMIDPAGSNAAAMARQRQAVAGGLDSTISPGANSAGAYASATSGGKSLLGA